MALPYIHYRYVWPPRVWFLTRFGLKKGMFLKRNITDSIVLYIKGMILGSEKDMLFNGEK